MAKPTSATDRMHRLVEALRARAEAEEDLVLLEGDAGERIVARLGRRPPQVTLRIGEEGAVAVARSGGEQHGGEARIQDRLTVDLRDGFRWDDTLCDSADELAELLVRHMHRRLKAVGRGVQPRK